MKWIMAMLAVVTLGGTAMAQSSCGDYMNMAFQLDQTYGEARIGLGLSGPASFFEVWASAEGDHTWTILQVFSNGQACVRASGENWQVGTVTEPVIPGDPA